MTAGRLPPDTDNRFSIAGCGLDLDPEQRRLIGLAERLGRRFAERAERYDREAGFPFENFDDMREAGMLALCVPREHGGLGADLFTYALVSATLGRFCGATALTFNMHACSALWPGPLADALDMTAEQRAEHERHRALHFRRMVEDGAVYAQPFSEPSAAAAGHAPYGTTATKVDGGWVVNGRKIFASLSGAADYYGVLCTEVRPGSEAPSLRDTLYLAVPKDAPGFSIVGDWDPLGMRGTVSRTLLLNDVYLPDSAQMMPRGVYYQAANRWPHMFATLSPTYMGIAMAAYEFTVRYLRGEVEGMEPPMRRRMHHSKQMTTAQMHILLEQTRALFLRTFAEARVDPPRDIRLRAYAAQYTVMENANEIARLAIRACGGQSMLKGLPLERLYRDSRCGSLMLPWTAELCLERIGREALYEPGEADT
jgi:alkylation response protein AidB-like acyl-CoA dehydrogenase